MRPRHAAASSLLRSRGRASGEGDSRNCSAQRAPLGLEQLAHELNSLLDGSIRSLELAQGQLSSNGDRREVPLAALERLKIAREGLFHMAGLLQRAIANPAAGVLVFDQAEALDGQVGRILQSLEPMAAEHRVTVAVDITPKAAFLPTATLGPVILNGLRNAIEACAVGNSPNRRVELSIAIDRFDRLMILIVDSGSGVPEGLERGESSKPTGHGLGLEIASQIVGALGGDLRLTNIPFGGGAILQVFVPVRSLVPHG